MAQDGIPSWQDLKLALCDGCQECVYGSRDLGGEDSVRYTISYEYLQWATAGGCPMCTLLSYALTSSYPQDVEFADEDTEFDVELGVSTLQNDPKADYGTNNWHTRLGLLSIYLMSDSGRRAPANINKRLIVVAGEENISSNFIEARDDFVNLKSDSVSVVRVLLDQCLQQHPTCRQFDRSVDHKLNLPARLIDVSGHNKLTDGECDLKLVTTASIAGSPEYLALSYCWGGPQACCTTQDNINHRMIGFSAVEVQGSIWDAIELISLVGIRYLWVDALCIIQDDESDKMREIALMKDIYGCATATILVEATTRSSEGFLKSFGKVKIFHVPYLCPDGEWSSIQVHEVDDEEPPLRERAWTLQEEVLSPRRIVFGSDTISWRCRQSQTYSLQQRLIGNRMASAIQNLPPYSASDITYGNHSASTNRGVQSHLVTSSEIQFWLDVLDEYTPRSATLAQDRLLAVGGLAARLAEQWPWTYVAGLWLEWIDHGITWTRDTVTGIGWSDRLHHRPETYVAPSWSWASVIGGCGWGSPGSCEFEDESCITIHECSIQLQDDSNPFGKVIGGWLRASGRMIGADFLRAEVQNCQSKGLKRLDFGYRTSIHADALESWDAMQQESYLLLLTQRKHGSLHEYGRQKIRCCRLEYKGAVSQIEAAMWQACTKRGKVLKRWRSRSDALLIVGGMIIRPVQGKIDTYERIGYWRDVVQPRTLDLMKERYITII